MPCGDFLYQVHCLDHMGVKLRCQMKEQQIFFMIVSKAGFDRRWIFCLLSGLFVVDVLVAVKRFCKEIIVEGQHQCVSMQFT